MSLINHTGCIVWESRLGAWAFSRGCRRHSLSKLIAFSGNWHLPKLSTPHLSSQWSSLRQLNCMLYCSFIQILRITTLKLQISIALWLTIGLNKKGDRQQCYQGYLSPGAADFISHEDSSFPRHTHPVDHPGSISTQPIKDNSWNTGTVSRLGYKDTTFPIKEVCPPAQRAEMNAVARTNEGENAILSRFPGRG